ncbi:MAG: hypothetical protein ABIS45_04035 [Burkholderiales bacterium]
MHSLATFLLCFALCAISEAHSADAPEKTFTIEIVRGAAPAAQRVLKVEKGDALRIRITSDAPGELHVHGYQLAAPVAAGKPAELAFKAYATGRYPIEWHAADKRGSAAAHRGPPLAALEVHPK